MAKTKDSSTIPTDTLFAATAMAARMNNRAYHKTTFDIDGVTQYANKVLIEQALSGDLNITDEDRESGATLRLHFQGLMFKLLAGAKLSDFDKKTIGIATRDEATKLDLAIVASLPLLYDKAQERKLQDDRLADGERGFVGNVGDRVNLNIEVVKSYWLDASLTRYCGHSVTALTKDNFKVGFISQHQFRVGQQVNITAKVKSQFLPTYTTYLNYVKEVVAK
jgi:hypothetical protein